MSDRWRDRVAVVTGASRGIGAAVARTLLDRGLRVAVAARTEAPLLALREAHGPDRVLPVACDMRDEASILALFQAVDAAWGGLDVLVNNAGLGHRAPLLEGPVEHWREMLEVNVLGLSIATREAVRRMRARGDRGHVVHVSSMSAHRVPPGGGMYAASKHAVRALTEALRQELVAAGSAIRVSSVSPGFVETGFAAHYHGSEAAAREVYSRFRVLRPEDVARVVWQVLDQPEHVAVHDVLLRPREQPT